MEYFVFVFSFTIILLCSFIVVLLLKPILNLLSKRFFRNWNVKNILIKSSATLFAISIISSFYFSYRIVYPSDSELIETFENSFKLKYPSSGVIISKKADRGFNDSYTYFTIKIDRQNEYDKIKYDLVKQNYKISSHHSYNRMSDTIYTVTRLNTFNIQFINDNEIFFEEIN